MNLNDTKFEHIDSDKDYPNARSIGLHLYGGYHIVYDDLLEGGGIEHRKDFLHIIHKLKTPIYENALEWCAGSGMIGFELLGVGKVKFMHFMDSYKPAIDSCLESAIKNNIQDKINVFHTDTIKSITTDKKFDLVVGNPPNGFSKSDWLRIQNPELLSNEFLLENLSRICIDDNMNIHKEFFDNIRDKVTEDADIFISVIGDENEVVRYAENKGFYVVASWFMKSCSGKILHIKPTFAGFTI